MAQSTIHENEVLRLTDLAVASDAIVGHVFENCLLIGPVVLVIANDVVLEGCHLGPPPARQLVWVFADDEQPPLGAVWVPKCRFVNCTFYRVGYAGSSKLLENFLGFESNE